MAKMSNRILTLELSEETAATLEAEAASVGVSLSEFVASLVRANAAARSGWTDKELASLGAAAEAHINHEGFADRAAVAAIFQRAGLSWP
jgi:hypothetical protein